MHTPFQLRAHRCIPLMLCWMLAATYSLRAATALEPWADPRMPLSQDVLMWYDASRQSAARGPLSLPPLTSGKRVDRLFDASGHRFHLAQPRLEGRARFRQEFNAAFLNFDGEDDALSIELPRQTLRELTLFVVAQPRTNSVPFQGLAAGHRIGANDYTTGFNLDLGPMPSSQLIFLNAEGAGFNGAQQLLKPGARPLQQWHIFALTIETGAQGVTLHLDGERQLSRSRTLDAPVILDSFTLGARSYSNTGEAPHQQGHFAGNIAECLVFDAGLSEKDRQKVEGYLMEKYGAVLRRNASELAHSPEGAVPLVTLTNPPPVQWFLPGFDIQRLPIELGNINSIRCREDGTLVAVCYDGHIWHLRDTNQDELEDQATPFWNTNSIRSPVGAALTPPGYPRGRGLFVAAKDKVTLITDTNGDDQGDTETVVATWTERSEQQGVDALGVAIDRDGSVLFGLGAASYTDAFLFDRVTGKARYSTQMERGTIQRVAPDFSSRKTVATGIRFSVGMAFNSRGDLFCTDQEGATWLPNGNPFDELLHIQEGRHYGFPPRHPQHLPMVFDEPSVADYAPQHQSTCGFCFNEPVGNGPTFGPASWRGDALVTGYSRGKLWRTQLVPTPEGYISKSHLLATFQSLVADVCVTRRGDLIVATHSGQPDWGSGPQGKGHLYRIRYREAHDAKHSSPQIAAAWNASPTEATVSFDRPIQAAQVKDLAHRAQIEQGAFVFPGDRFENIRPGYQVVYDQLNTPRYGSSILGSRLSPDRRQLTLQTPARFQAWNHVITLPTEESKSFWDLQTDLHGIQATWNNGTFAQSLWWPHLDPDVTKVLTRGSALHESFWELLNQAGELKMESQWNLYELLQPAIQPGATLDYSRPPEHARVRLRSSHPFHLRCGDQEWNSKAASDESKKAFQEIIWDQTITNHSWIPFTLTLKKDQGALSLHVAWSTQEESRWRPMQLKRTLLPWATPAGHSRNEPNALSRSQSPPLNGAQWNRGRNLFFSQRLGCSTCHTHSGVGGKVGPDLSNLYHRDRASIRKDIEFPNAAMNPDHLAMNLETRSGDLLIVRVLQETGDALTIMDGKGMIRTLARREVASLEMSKLSLMPEGLWTLMNENEQRDLMTFLMTEPLLPHPVPLEAQGRKIPPARTLPEINSVLSQRQPQSPAREWKPVHVVLCASPKDPGHGAPGFHDYPVWRDRWSRLLSFSENTTVEQADRWPSAEQWSKADLVAFYHDNPAWVAEKAGDLDQFLARGGGLVFLHWSMNAYKDLEPLSVRLARAWGPGAKFRQGDEELIFHPHEVTQGLPKITITDETYWNLRGEFKDATVLASTVEEGQPQPQIWTRQQGRGRVLVCIPGHYTWTFDDPLFRLVLLRGMAWTAQQPLERWESLSTLGARIQAGSQ